MNNKFFWLSVMLTLLYASFLNAQNPAPNNIFVQYQDFSSIPDQLNLCGNTEEVSVLISHEKNDNLTISNVFATLRLFKGVRFRGFVPERSSAGVFVSDSSNVYQPSFRIPDLKKGFTPDSKVRVTFKISADCAYLDTLNQNSNISVYDVWDFSYSINPPDVQREQHATAEYKDAFEIPEFSLLVLDRSTKARKNGECFTRKISVSNSGLRGYTTGLKYQILQGNAICYKALVVNGDPIPISKMAQSNGDTLIEAIIPGEYFIKNRIGTGSSNADKFFDPNENMIVEEQICIMDCTSSNFSTHSVIWGCFDKECAVSSINDAVNVGVGLPNPIFSNQGSVPVQSVGFCKLATAVAVYTNDGSEIDQGFGTMYNLQASIGFSNGFFSKIKGYEVIRYNIAGLNLPLGSNTSTDLRNNLAFKSDPDGPGGLSDADNDGFFDDLPIGQSIELRLDYEFVCAEQDTGKLCLNNRNVSVSSLLEYQTACGENASKLNDNIQAASNSNSGYENLTQTDAFIGIKDTFIISHTEDRSMFSFEKNCNGAEKFYAKIFLPKGIEPVISRFGLFKNGNTLGQNLLSSNIKNDTLYIYFDASDPFLNGKYDLKMAFIANCNAEAGVVKFPFEFGFICPSCTCTMPWFCDVMNGPKLHLTSICRSVNCPKGLTTSEFEVKRTTFGYTDASFTKKVDPKKVNSKIAISCDSIDFRVKAVVGNTAINDSIAVQIQYSNIAGYNGPNAANAEIFKFCKGRLRIKKGNLNQFCAVSAANAVLIPGTDKILRIDLNSCLQP
ncbi:MAG: hypothetical protein ACOYOA_12925, partial [Saprospiraceae bacterium]